MTEQDKSIVRKTESIIDDLVDLWRRRRWICVLVFLVIIAPASFGLFVQFVTIPALKSKADAAHTKLESATQTHRDEMYKMTSRVQGLETELTPFRTYAIQKFASADSIAMRKLAEHLTSVDTDLKHAQTEISHLKASVTELKPSFRLLEQNQIKKDDTWVTRMAFGRKNWTPLPALCGCRRV